MESSLTNDIEVGVDEAGRGSLAGPVFAAAVILPSDFESDLIDDSKKLTEKKRKKAFEEIKEKAIDWSYAYVKADKIDEINIQKSVYSAMHKAIDKLDTKPKHILVDGNIFDGHEIPHTCIVKGDSKYYSIAAASIVAKVMRDEYMEKIDIDYPQYKWKNNKGYGSKEHVNIIKEEGITKYHRKTFLNNILKSDLIE